MKTIRIKKMAIENFKGLSSFSVDFDDDVTRIIGANGTGKTTLHDAYLWLLLGIDSANRASFAVQPLDATSKTIDHLTTSVTGVFVIDGVQHELKRSLHQTWTRRRGTKEDVLTGSQSEYFIDNVPYKAGEFLGKVDSLFCPLDDFRLISSIKAFGQLDMKTKRMKLIQMAGQMPELINDVDYPRLAKYYSSSKNVESIKRQVKYEMDILKGKQAEIPIRMTENERNLPTGIDFDSLKAELAEKQQELEKIDALLQKEADGRSSLFNEMNSLNDQLKAVSAELTEIESGLTSQLQKRLSELQKEYLDADKQKREIEYEKSIVKRDIEDLENRIGICHKRKQELASQWIAKNQEKWPDNIETECPTCHRPYDEADIENARNEAIKAFNSGKTGVLARIEAEGDAVVKDIAKFNEDLDKRKKDLEGLDSGLGTINEVIAEIKKKVSEVPTLDFLKENSKEYQTVLARRHDLKVRIMNESPKESDDERSLKNRKEAIKTEISMLTYQLAKEQDIAKVEARRKELEEENSKLATGIAELDAVMYEISCFQKAYIELVESRVSSMFSLVTWKMYQKNVSNEGETEICECLVNGVPVSTNVNTAGGINAGIDIINALSNWLKVSVPLWIDGKESVCNLIDSRAQLITLQVVENQPLQRV